MTYPKFNILRYSEPSIEYFTEFLRQYADLLKGSPTTQDWLDLYRAWTAGSIGPSYGPFGKAHYSGAFLTKFLLEAGVDPLAGSDTIPAEYLYSTDITQFTIPSRIKAIGTAAFAASKLTSIVIPNNVTLLSEPGGRFFSFGVFTSCSSLRSVQLSKNIRRIPAQMFLNCWKLKEIDIPEGVQSIGCDAFGDCVDLAKITLPSTLEHIEAAALYNCASLVSIMFRGTKAQWRKVQKDKEWKMGCHSLMKVICSDGEIPLKVTRNPLRTVDHIKSMDTYEPD